MSAAPAGNTSRGEGGRAPRAERPARSKPRQPKADAPTQQEEPDVSAEQVADEAAKFLTDLIAAFGLTGEVTSNEDGDDIEMSVTGDDLGLLVGPRGNTLLAI
ncbi:MAG TPA: hypothetical protein PLV68_10590, partial [Ilumatobacteraceae bacterium]|nr:hypothetical protein [Ilumatobacteraceae bacterium]